MADSQARVQPTSIITLIRSTPFCDQAKTGFSLM
jgi:hypothetical protein